MKITTYNKKFYNYILASVGFLMFVSYIWLRFIRERLPRDIPFDLTLISFFILIIIIITLGFIIYRIKNPKVPPKFIYDFIQILIKILKPLEYFDDLLKQKGNVQQRILHIVFFLIKKYKLYNSIKNYRLFFILNVIPKILLLTVFMIDIFFLHKIEYFYAFILLNIIPLFYIYIIYTLKKQAEIYTLYLEKAFYIDIISTIEEEDNNIKDFMCQIINLKNHPDDEVDPWNPAIPFKDVRFFIDMQACNLVFDYDLYEYTCVETDYGREEYAKKHNRNIPITSREYIPNFDDVSIILRKEFEDIIPKVVYIKAFLRVYDNIIKPKMLKNWSNFFIILGYIICWTYILIVSFHTLNLLDLINIVENTCSNMPEPFTEIAINLDDENNNK